MDPEEPRYDSNLAQIKTEEKFNKFFTENAICDYYQDHEYWKCQGFVAAGDYYRLYNFVRKCWEYSVKKSTISMLKDGTVAQAVRALV